MEGVVARPSNFPDIVKLVSYKDNRKALNQMAFLSLSYEIVEYISKLSYELIWTNT
jgi:hypothetical protein